MRMLKHQKETALREASTAAAAAAAAAAEAAWYDDIVKRATRDTAVATATNVMRLPLEQAQTASAKSQSTGPDPTSLVGSQSGGEKNEEVGEDRDWQQQQ